MERAIGEIFELEGKKYRAEEGEGCVNCNFNNDECCYDRFGFDEIIGECSSIYRKDEKNVIFVKIVD